MSKRQRNLKHSLEEEKSRVKLYKSGKHWIHGVLPHEIVLRKGYLRDLSQIRLIMRRAPGGTRERPLCLTFSDPAGSIVPRSGAVEECRRNHMKR